jgi:hypothetical protein
MPAGRRTNFWVQEERRLVNPACPSAPSITAWWKWPIPRPSATSPSASMPGWSTRLRGVAGVGAAPSHGSERAAGYPWRLSIYQAEFSDHGIFHRTEVLNRVYEDLVRGHRHLGRPDMLKVVFDRQIRRNTPGTFKTRLLGQGVVGLSEGLLREELPQAVQQGRAGVANRGLRQRPPGLAD